MGGPAFARDADTTHVCQREGGSYEPDISDLDRIAAARGNPHRDTEPTLWTPHIGV
ncbi:hypothetical protein MSHI_41020 [Mycobacterium shinjukuense]|uniref:Uncharacterized protein n=1 Tax=Mycobacterium shinjukuense TaxID=398694 RepID=A0A7I7MVQ1_9MYCO|nr:hypothetical protein MSHI_41020 [Mycobacterium shinjukuense]